jgi:hypothetical protein
MDQMRLLSFFKKKPICILEYKEVFEFQSLEDTTIEPTNSDCLKVHATIAQVLKRCRID